MLCGFSLTSHPPEHRSSSKSEVAGGRREERRGLDDGSAVRNHVPGKRSGNMIGTSSRAPRKEQILLQGGESCSRTAFQEHDRDDLSGVLLGRLGALSKAFWAVSEPSCGPRPRLSSSSSPTPRSLTSHPPEHRSSSKSDAAGGRREERRGLNDGSAVRNHVPGKRSGNMIGTASRAPREEQMLLKGGESCSGPPSWNMIGTVSAACWWAVLEPS